MTPACLYRCIEREQPTLLIDEQQLIGTRTQQALKELLDHGYKRGGQVERSGASGASFDVYCPKAIALIGQLPDTLATRCIPIYMDPLGPDDVVDPYIPQRGEDPYLTLLQGACVEWANVEGNGLHRNYVACLRGGAMGFQRSRRRNLAVFVHRMSNCRASPHQRLKGLADRLLATRQDLGHQHVAIRLLSDLREILDRVNGNRIRSEALVQELRRIEDWSTINEKVMANILAPFRFYPTRIRLGPDTYRGNYVASFQRVFRQYLPPRPERVRHDTVSA